MLVYLKSSVESFILVFPNFYIIISLALVPSMGKDSDDLRTDMGHALKDLEESFFGCA